MNMKYLYSIVYFLNILNIILPSTTDMLIVQETFLKRKDTAQIDTFLRTDLLTTIHQKLLDRMSSKTSIHDNFDCPFTVVRPDKGGVYHLFDQTDELMSIKNTCS